MLPDGLPSGEERFDWIVCQIVSLQGSGGGVELLFQLAMTTFGASPARKFTLSPSVSATGVSRSPWILYYPPMEGSDINAHRGNFGGNRHY